MNQLIVYGEVRMYRLSFVNRDDDDDDVMMMMMMMKREKKFFKFLHIRPTEHAWCELLAVGNTPSGKDFCY